MSTKIAINGFGRIGRQAFKAALDIKGLEVVAINDLMDAETLAYLLKYDSVYGKYDKKVEVKKENIVVDGKEFKVFAQKEPEKLPWKKLDIDVALECTGFFTERELAQKHLDAGAKKVLISTNAKGGVRPIVIGVNDDQYNPKTDNIIANGSCTTNSLAPLTKVLDDVFGIDKALMTTIHSYTSTQGLVDSPSRKDMRRGRAAAENLVLTSTGAAKATCEVMTNLADKFDGKSVRVPTPTVSLIDLSAILSREATLSEVNNAFVQASKGKLKDILGVTDEPLVSKDFVGDIRTSIVDLSSTMSIGNLVKVFAWYDNEYGYAYGLAKTALFIGTK